MEYESIITFVNTPIPPLVLTLIFFVISIIGMLIVTSDKVIKPK
jgi:hypothetical protein